MLPEFSLIEYLLTGLLFMWAGFVRSGLGFGGAALGLPLMLFIVDQPLFWLPMIGVHLLFFSGITLSRRMHHVNWEYLSRSSVYVIPATLAGIFGLLNLPNEFLILFVYGITLFYAITWLINWTITSNNSLVDKFLLITGSYIAGTSLTGAPLIVAVFTRHVQSAQLRNTLFVLWFVIVSIKMTAFVVLDVEINLLLATLLIPVAAIGHWLGLQTHDRILQNDQQFKRIIGIVLALISVLGLMRLFL